MRLKYNEFTRATQIAATNGFSADGFDYIRFAKSNEVCEM